MITKTAIASFVLSVLCHWLMVLGLAPLLIGTINKVKAFFAGKRGPSLFQPYYDLRRLLRKECAYSRTTTWVFRAAPVAVLTATLTVALMVPMGGFRAPVQFAGDIFLAAYLLALARFFMIEAAMAHTHGLKQDAAIVLGWGRNTLARKMKELGMD